MTEVRSENYDWLSKFFSSRNAIRWEDLETNAEPDDWGKDVSGWLSILNSGHADAPVCLPCLSEDGSIQWYAGSRSLQGAYALAEELRAFIGKSYSDFDGRPHILDLSDPVEAALKGVFANPLFRIETRNSKEASNLHRAVSLYQALVSRRPSALRPATRPFGVIRGHFDRALLAGNEAEAWRLLEEMKRTGRLTSESLKFLEVRLLAGLGLWHQIVHASLLRDLTDFPLPPRVVRDVSEALYRVYIEPYEQKGGLGQCLAALRDSSSITRLGPLFSSRHGIEHAPVIKLFLLHEMLRAPADLIYARDLFSRLDKQDRSPLLDQISDHLTSIETAQAALQARKDNSEGAEPDLWREVDEAFEDNEFDRALVLYLALPVTAKSLQRMVICARDSGDETSARKVLECYESIGDEEAAKLGPAVVRALQSLREQSQPIPVKQVSTEPFVEAEKPVKTSWLDWAHWVARGASLKESESVVQRYAETWSIDELCNYPERAEVFATLIGNAEREPEAVFRASFPTLFRTFVIEIDEPTFSLKPLYENLLFLMTTSDRLSRDDLEISTQLISSVLAFGTTAEEYKDIIDELTQMLDRHGALLTLDWALDVAEALAIERSPDDEARLRFLASLLTLAQALSHRLSTSHRRAITLVCRDYGMTIPEGLRQPPNDNQVQEDADIAQRLSGKTVGIYTLTEQAGKRAAKMLMEIAPESEIIVNNDHVCTDRLSVLAKSADIFVFAWKSSKHQAFYCVKKHRPSDLPLLQPLGKGSASIIREIVENV